MGGGECLGGGRRGVFLDFTSSCVDCWVAYSQTADFLDIFYKKGHGPWGICDGHVLGSRSEASQLSFGTGFGYDCGHFITPFSPFSFLLFIFILLLLSNLLFNAGFLLESSRFPAVAYSLGFSTYLTMIPWEASSSG